MSDIFYMSREGLEKLQEEVKYLRGTKRKEIARAIAEMETKLANARIADESKMDASKANILSTVEVLNIKMNKKMTFTLVSEAEANLKEGKLSVSSPIGKVLLGKVIGSKVKAQTPAGEVEFEILKISF